MPAVIFHRHYRFCPRGLVYETVPPSPPLPLPRCCFFPMPLFRSPEKRVCEQQREGSGCSGQAHQCSDMLVGGEPPPPPPRGPGPEPPGPPNRGGLLPTPPGPPPPPAPMPVDSQVLAGPPGAPPRGRPLLPTPPLTNSTGEAQEPFGADANLSGAPPPPPRPAVAPADEGSAPPPPPRMLARPAGDDAPSDVAGASGGDGGVPPPPPPRKMSPGASAGGSAPAGEIPFVLRVGENHLAQPRVCLCVCVTCYSSCELYGSVDMLGIAQV